MTKEGRRECKGTSGHDLEKIGNVVLPNGVNAEKFHCKKCDAVVIK